MKLPLLLVVLVAGARLHISDVELCRATACRRRNVVKPTHERFWNVSQPMEPSGRVAWAGEGSFARAHLSRVGQHMDFTCVQVAGLHTSVCVRREKEYYLWGKAQIVARPVACRANHICAFNITKPLVMHAAVSLVKPLSLQFWIDQLAPNIPLNLHYAVQASVDASLVVTFRGPGTKVLWFKPLLWAILATPILPMDVGPTILTTLPLVHESGFLDGLYGIADPSSFRA